MSRARLGFCDEYGYPPEVRTHLQTLLSPVTEESVDSVLLIGGTSRGEFSYRRNGEDLELFSDYEFLLVIDGRPSRSFKRTFDEYVESFERSVGGTPFFHVDYNYLSARSLENMEKNFFTYDAKSTGVPIWGEDCRHLLPEVTADNIDLRETNETLIWRLWSIFLYAPPALIWGESDEPWRTYFAYAVCKNVLDLTTWALPHEGQLLSSFEARVKQFRDRFDSMSVRPFFDDEFPAFLTRCLAGKLELAASREDPIELYDEAIEYFESAVQYLRSEFGLGGESENVFETESHEVFRDHSYKYRAYDVYLYAKDGVWPSPTSPLWLRRGKRGLTLLTLLSAHRFLRSVATGEPAVEHLETAERRLETLTLTAEDDAATAPDECGDLRSRFESFRRTLLTFMKRYYRWIGNQATHVDTVQQAMMDDG